MSYKDLVPKSTGPAPLHHIIYKDCLKLNNEPYDSDAIEEEYKEKYKKWKNQVDKTLLYYKKQKLCKEIKREYKKRKFEVYYNNVISTSSVSSTIFPNESDHFQFQEIFNVIDQSLLAKNITHYISQQIAEYATGHFVKCDVCKDDMHILKQYETICYNDSNYADTLGFKWNHQGWGTNNYFSLYLCSECMWMREENPCCCGTLTLLPEYSRCCACDTILYSCHCDCNVCKRYDCDMCCDKYCNECRDTMFYRML
eukprot:44571_1